jgi:hypothetical protein
MQDFSQNKNMKTNLKFTFEVGKKVPFLDTKVSIAEGKLVTKLYSKPTDQPLLENSKLSPKVMHQGPCEKGTAESTSILHK